MVSAMTFSQMNHTWEVGKPPLGKHGYELKGEPWTAWKTLGMDADLQQAPEIPQGVSERQQVRALREE